MMTKGAKIYVRRNKDDARMIVLAMDDEWVTIAKTRFDGHGPPWQVSSVTFWTLYRKE